MYICTYVCTHAGLSLWCNCAPCGLFHYLKNNDGAFYPNKMCHGVLWKLDIFPQHTWDYPMLHWCAAAFVQVALQTLLQLSCWRLQCPVTMSSCFMEKWIEGCIAT